MNEYADRLLDPGRDRRVRRHPRTQRERRERAQRLHQRRIHRRDAEVVMRDDQHAGRQVMILVERDRVARRAPDDERRMERQQRDHPRALTAANRGGETRDRGGARGHRGRTLGRAGARRAHGVRCGARSRLSRGFRGSATSSGGVPVVERLEQSIGSEATAPWSASREFCGRPHGQRQAPGRRNRPGARAASHDKRVVVRRGAHNDEVKHGHLVPPRGSRMRVRLRLFNDHHGIQLQ